MAAHLQDLQRSFLRHLRADGRSPATLRLYGQAVTFFSRWLESEGRTATVDEPTEQPSAIGWPAQRGPRAPAPSKVRNPGLFRFCPWLVDEDELPSNPMDLNLDRFVMARSRAR